MADFECEPREVPSVFTDSSIAKKRKKKKRHRSDKRLTESEININDKEGDIQKNTEVETNQCFQELSFIKSKKKRNKKKKHFSESDTVRVTENEIDINQQEEESLGNTLTDIVINQGQVDLGHDNSRIHISKKKSGKNPGGNKHSSEVINEIVIEKEHFVEETSTEVNTALSDKSRTDDGEVSYIRTVVSDQQFLDIVMEPEVLSGKYGNTYPLNINWKKVAEKCRKQIDIPLSLTESHVKSRWKELTLNVRKIRTIKEIVDDIDLEEYHKRKKYEVIKGKKRRYVDTLAKNERPPKQPLTNFVIFYNSKRPKIRRKYPDMKETDIKKQLGNKWMNMTPLRKNKYTKKVEKAKIKYEEEFKVWCKEHPDHYKCMVNEKVPSFKSVKPGPLKLPSPAQLPRPEKPLSAFELFVSKKRDSLKAKYPSLLENELNHKLDRRWNKLAEENRLDYFHKAEEAQNEYRQNLRQWFDKIEAVNNGNPIVLKKPLTSYLLFYSDCRTLLHKEFPEKSFIDITKLISVRWQERTREEENVYAKKARELKLQYKQDLKLLKEAMS